MNCCYSGRGDLVRYTSDLLPWAWCFSKAFRLMSTDQADLSVTVLIWVRCFVMAPNPWEEQWWFRASWEHVSIWLQCGDRNPFSPGLDNPRMSSVSSHLVGHVYWARWGAGTLVGAAVLSPRSVLSCIKLECGSQACPFFTSQAVASAGLQTQVCPFVVFQCFLFQEIVTFSCWWRFNPPGLKQCLLHSRCLPASPARAADLTHREQDRVTQGWAASPEPPDRALKDREETTWDHEGRETRLSSGKPCSQNETSPSVWNPGRSAVHRTVGSQGEGSQGCLLLSMAKAPRSAYCSFQF